MATERSQHDLPSKEEEMLRAIGPLVADAGLSPPLVLKALRTDARRTAHPRRALTNFHRFLLTGFPSAWLRDFHEHRLLQQILLELFAQSQFLADILVRNPELFRWLTSSNILQTTATKEQYALDAVNAASLFQRMEKKVDSLKRFHRRELLRIGGRQILKEAEVRTTSLELSALADSIVEAALALAYGQIAEGIPATLPRNLAVIGLGKLGGEELNFSSDIDLMFVYDEDGPLVPAIGRIATLHEYYSRVAEYVVRRLTEHTSEGHLYRVDMRLRPDGQSGPLAISRSAYMTYYESRGELWERQMLIKARVIAGDREVGERWKRDIRPFVYHKTMFSSPIEEIATIKSRIESRLEAGTNIKLGSGGIRDIEFVVQALQLLNGGGNPELQTESTLRALANLSVAGLLKSAEAEGLQRAYAFLRTAEDRLQLLHGLQEHSLPESAEEKRILAKQLGYSTVKSFEKELSQHQRNIRNVYSAVFGSSLPGNGGVDGPEALVSQREFAAVGFVEPFSASKNLNALLAEIPALRPKERLSGFLKSVRRGGAPDRCLDHLCLLLASAPIKRALAQAAANESALELIMLLASRSSKNVTLLSREPLLFEALVGRSEDLLGRGFGWSFLKSNDLPRYKQFNEFKVVLRFLAGETSVRALTEELSDLADDVLRFAFERSRESIPECGRTPIAILGMGKLGGRELSVGSDLDLVLLYRDDGGAVSSRAVNALGRTLRQFLEGVYVVDFRLRPEGRNAPLATEVNYYHQYLSDRASLWERQALLKTRFLAGDREFGTATVGTFRQFICTTNLPASWKREIAAMRKRMAVERSKRNSKADLKVGVGGLVDLEFLVQSMQLRFGRQLAEAMQTNTFDMISILGAAGFLKKKVALRIADNLSFMRALEASIRLNAETQDFVLPAEPARLRLIAASMQLNSVHELKASVQKVRTENRSLFVSMLKSLPR
jgi:glutamate-ammonia-ligase adenylyltransferase